MTTTDTTTHRPYGEALAETNTGFAVGDRVWLKNANGVPVAHMNNAHTAHEVVTFTITAVTDWQSGTRYELDTDNVFARRRHCGGFGETADWLMRPEAESEDSR